MRQTVAKLAHAYTPMIKFVGKHPHIKHSGAVKEHPCATSGLLPGSQDCVPAGEFLTNLKPFKVIPYQSSKSNGPVSGSTSPTGSASAKIAETNKSRYAFVDRPLQENEVGSIFELPARFRFKPISEVESEAINGGGAI